MGRGRHRHNLLGRRTAYLDDLSLRNSRSATLDARQLYRGRQLGEFAMRFCAPSGTSRNYDLAVDHPAAGASRAAIRNEAAVERGYGLPRPHIPPPDSPVLPPTCPPKGTALASATSQRGQANTTDAPSRRNPIHEDSRWRPHCPLRRRGRCPQDAAIAHPAPT